MLAGDVVGGADAHEDELRAHRDALGSVAERDRLRGCLAQAGDQRLDRLGLAIRARPEGGRPREPGLRGGTANVVSGA